MGQILWQIQFIYDSENWRNEEKKKSQRRYIYPMRCIFPFKENFWIREFFLYFATKIVRLVHIYRIQASKKQIFGKIKKIQKCWNKNFPCEGILFKNWTFPKFYFFNINLFIKVEWNISKDAEDPFKGFFFLKWEIFGFCFQNYSLKILFQNLIIFEN